MDPGRTTRLEPFPTGAGRVAGTLHACVTRDARLLRYRLSLAVPGLVLPPAADVPGRRHGLWRRTCAELFIGVPPDRGYLEWNLSPSGHWNLYRFDDYRAGGRESPEDVRPTLELTRTTTGAVVEGALPLGPLRLERSRLVLGVCAVVETGDGALSHWAAHHPAERPDFHDRRGFVLDLPASSSPQPEPRNPEVDS